MLLFDMIQELDCAAITHTLKPIHQHIDAIVVPFKHAEAIATERRFVVPHDALDFLVLAWHHEHLIYQSGSQPKRYPQKERDFWLAGAAGLLGTEVDTLKALGFDKLDTIVRASSLVEMVNSLIRPSLKSCKGQITQETLNLIMFYHNHRRYKSGKRQGQAPLALLTGEPLEAPWWELLRRQVNAKQGVTDPRTLPSRPLLQLVTNNDWGTAHQALASDHAILDPTGTSENDGQQKDSKAASLFHLCRNSAFLRALLEGPDCAYIEPYLSSNPANCQLLLPCFERCQFLLGEVVDDESPIVGRVAPRRQPRREVVLLAGREGDEEDELLLGLAGQAQDEVVGLHGLLLPLHGTDRQTPEVLLVVEHLGVAHVVDGIHPRLDPE